MRAKIVIFILMVGAVSFFLPEKINGLESVNKNSSEGAIFYNNAKFLKAIKQFKTLADQGDIKGYLNLAVIFKDLGNYDKAVEILNKAKQKFGSDLRVLSFLARLYYLNHQIEEAIEILKRILEIRPQDLEANINLGLCYAEKGNDSEAEKYSQTAVSLSKNNIIARISLTDIYQRKEKIQEAIEEYKKVSIIDASILNVQNILGDLLFRSGNLEESLKIYRKILLREPQNILIQTRVKEINDRLGEEYLKKERQRLTFLREQKKVLIKPFPPAKDIPLVRVGLLKGQGSIEIKCLSPFEIKTKSRQIKVSTGLEDKIYLISKGVNNKIVIRGPKKENIIIDEPILIKPTRPEATITIFNVVLGKDNFWMSQNDRSYRGTIEVSVDKDGIKVINIINLEEYLYGVLPSEMPVNWPKEALKAQSIAARSEAVKKLARHKEDGYDFCAEVHCQVYRGVEQETTQTNGVVDETRGIIMVYQDKPIDALYSSNCGGHTQGNIFGSGEDLYYLQARLDSLENKNLNFPLSPLDLEYWLKTSPEGILCNTIESAQPYTQGLDLGNSSFRWIRLYSYEEIKEMLNRITDFGEIKKIIISQRNKSAHITQLKIIGSNTTYILKRELNIRKALGNLRSSMFKIEIKKDSNGKPKQFIFYGGGFGHGVGMCQFGAYGMAVLGKNYKEILRHYYQGIDFKKIY